MVKVTLQLEQLSLLDHSLSKLVEFPVIPHRGDTVVVLGENFEVIRSIFPIGGQPTLVLRWEHLEFCRDPFSSRAVSDDSLLSSKRVYEAKWASFIVAAQKDGWAQRRQDQEQTESTIKAGDKVLWRGMKGVVQCRIAIVDEILGQVPGWTVLFPDRICDVPDTDQMVLLN